MSEHWEGVIEQELNFVFNSPKYEAQLKERLLENELNIQYPVTQFDTERGMVYLLCPGTEEQAIRRIEKREALENGIKRINKRVSRLMNALNQLSEEEQDLIVWVYLERDHPPKPFMARTLGYRTVKEFEKAKKDSLIKLMKIYEDERKESESDYRKRLDEIRKEKARIFKGVQGL